MKSHQNPNSSGKETYKLKPLVVSETGITVPTKGPFRITKLALTWRTSLQVPGVRPAVLLCCPGGAGPAPALLQEPTHRGS